MKQYEYYYVVGLYSIKTRQPIHIYKLTVSEIDAINDYFSRWEYEHNPQLYVGYYYRNELYQLSKFKAEAIEGPGLFNTTTVSLKEIQNYQKY